MKPIIAHLMIGIVPFVLGGQYIEDKHVDEVMEKCSAATPVTTKDILMFETPENIKCFAKCFFEGVGLMKDGKLEENNADDFMKDYFEEFGDNSPLLQAYFKECYKNNERTKSDNKCEVAWGGYECAFKTYEKTIWLSPK